ncbi:hypothetical protein [Poriferisphaera sp. WC338]|uniref:hypothetical protein n=1 Tax=Poriferisphaera sp. WC338 TaxID=3425129 RepID=UPI003D81AAD7
MISTNITTEHLQKLFDEKCRANTHTLLNHLLHQPIEPHLESIARALHHALPELLVIVEQSHHVPMHQHHVAIHRILTDHDRAPYEPQTSPDAYAHHNHRIDQLTEELTTILESVRRSAIKCGDWSDRLAAPQFFG